MQSSTSNTATPLAGIVIAGGRSLRFGGEKAVALLRGKPLLLWAVERLRGACSVVAVNARPGTAAGTLAREHGLPVIHDMPGDPDGPLSGVKAGLAWAAAQGSTHLAASPCDVPLLPEDLHVRLGAAAGEGAAFAATSEGRQPQCAIWPVSALPALTAALQHGAHPPAWRMLEQIGAVQVYFESPARFTNLNTREDLARFESLVGTAAYQR